MARTPDRQRGRDREREKVESEFSDKLVHINRVAKVVKGGKRFGFAALVIVGDLKGRVGFGHGKAREVPEAIRKATEAARRNLLRVPLRDARTLHHDSEGRHGAGKVVLRSAPPGTGIIAGGSMRAVFEMLGVHDVARFQERLQRRACNVRRPEGAGKPAPCRRPPQQEGGRYRIAPPRWVGHGCRSRLRRLNSKFDLKVT